MSPLLEVSGLTKTFGGLSALSELDLEVAEGEVVSVIGPNGQCGATTTSYASAIAAMRRTSEMPPAWERSGWATAMPVGRTSRKSQRE